MKLAKRVLIIENDIDVAELLLEVLKSQFEEMTIDLCYDGQSGWDRIALAATQLQPYDIVLSDWNMPGLSGLEVLKKLRLDSTMTSVRFMMVTGQSERLQIIQAIKAGANAYVTKPLESAILIQKIADLY
ncbi:MAG: response regulator [Oligoflexus sp.]|nr:response regulator [Oligoflexus sp.]